MANRYGVPGAQYTKWTNMTLEDLSHLGYDDMKRAFRDIQREANRRHDSLMRHYQTRDQRKGPLALFIKRGGKLKNYKTDPNETKKQEMTRLYHEIRRGYVFINSETSNWTGWRKWFVNSKRAIARSLRDTKGIPGIPTPAPVLGVPQPSGPDALDNAIDKLFEGREGWKRFKNFWKMVDWVRDNYPEYVDDNGSPRLLALAELIITAAYDKSAGIRKDWENLTSEEQLIKSIKRVFSLYDADVMAEDDIDTAEELINSDQFFDDDFWDSDAYDPEQWDINN